MMTYDELGKILHERRGALGLSRRVLAERVDVVKNLKTIQSLELGQHRARLDVFLGVVEALGGKVKIVWGPEG